MTVSLDTDKGTSALIHPLGKDILGARMAAQYLAMEDGTTYLTDRLLNMHGILWTAKSPCLSKRHRKRLKAMQPNYSKTASASAPNYKKTSKATPLTVSAISHSHHCGIAGIRGCQFFRSMGSGQCHIRGNQVLLSAANGTILDNLNGMSQVRYLFSGNPKCASMLYNDLNLPASPFITIVE